MSEYIIIMWGAVLRKAFVSSERGDKGMTTAAVERVREKQNDTVSG
jgi:hypothetical protein